MSTNLYLTDAQYEEAMARLKGVVEGGGQSLQGFDDTTPGDKDTQCTWGLCGESASVYPAADMHSFPDLLPGRLSPKYRKQNHRCPFEDPKAKDQASGCFHRCRFFQQGQKPSVGVWGQWHAEALAWSARARKRASNNPDAWAICEDCHTAKPDVQERVCPFQEDVNGKIVIVQTCDSCNHDSIMGI